MANDPEQDTARVPISAEVSPSLRDELDAIANAEETTRATVIRWACREFVERRRGAEE